MALEFQRGIDALKQTGGGGGGSLFTPFVKWNDGDSKYVAILNPVEDIPKVFVHEFIPVDKRDDGKPIFAEFLDRTAPPIGEDEDPLTEKGSEPRERNIAVAVELEPVLGQGRGGRQRPKGFEVKTTEFKRKVLDDDGEDTGDKEEVVAPAIGFVMQSGANFFGYLGSFNEEEGPHQDVAFKVKRRGGDKQTAYDWTPYVDQELDLSNVVDFVDGISYLRRDLDELLPELEAAEDDNAAAHLIASKMLEKRLEELADPERYEKLTADIEEIKPKYGGKKKGKDDDEKTERKTQRSRRTKAKDADEPEQDGPPEETEETPETEPEEESREAKLAEFKALRAKAKKRKS